MLLAAGLLLFQERERCVITLTLFDLAHLTMCSTRVGANRGGYRICGGCGGIKGRAVSPGVSGGSRGETGLAWWWLAGPGLRLPLGQTKG